MFESDETILAMLGIYSAVGFCLAVLYNVLRFFRLAFPEFRKAAAVSDFMFAATAGLVMFAFSVDNGTGFFRLYYVAAAAFGFALNMVTLGLAVPPAAKLSGKLFRLIGNMICRIVMVPVNLFCNISTYICSNLQKYVSKIAEKRKTYLKKRREMVYNNLDHKIGEIYTEGGENRNAIKAKVRKII